MKFETPEPPVTVTQEQLSHAIRELYYWQYSYTHCFSNQLFDLFQKADVENKRKLSRAFPAEAKALEMWNNSPDHTILFKRHGLIKDDSGAV